MKFETARGIVAGTPHITDERARELYDFILRERPRRCLELGFAHGAGSVYIAAALDEIGEGGRLVSVDNRSAMNRRPSMREMLARSGLGAHVEPVFEERSYTWWLMRQLRDRQEPGFDFCYLDGAHTWDVDGFAFLLLDRLMKPGGWVIFDDLDWSLAEDPDVKPGDLPEEERLARQVRLIWDLLVVPHPNYGLLREDGMWGYARKLREGEVAADRRVEVLRQPIVLQVQRVAARLGRAARTLSRLRA